MERGVSRDGIQVVPTISKEKTFAKCKCSQSLTNRVEVITLAIKKGLLVLLWPDNPRVRSMYATQHAREVLLFCKVTLE